MKPTQKNKKTKLNESNQEHTILEINKKQSDHDKLR